MDLAEGHCCNIQLITLFIVVLHTDYHEGNTGLSILGYLEIGCLGTVAYTNVGAHGMFISWYPTDAVHEAKSSQH